MDSFEHSSKLQRGPKILSVHPKRHVDRLSRFCRLTAVTLDQHTETDTQTTLRLLQSIGRIYAFLPFKNLK